MSTHKQSVIRKTRKAQAVAAVLLLAGVAVAVLPLGDLGQKSRAYVEPDSQVAGPAVVRVNLNASELSEILRSRSRQVVRDAQPDVVVVPDPVVVDPVEQPPIPDGEQPDTELVVHGWVYLGFVETPRAKRALVRVGEAQRLLVEGETYQGVKLVRVEADHIVIERDGRERRIDLADRTVDWATNAPKTPVTFRNPLASAGANGGAGAFGGPGAASSTTQRGNAPVVAPPRTLQGNNANRLRGSERLLTPPARPDPRFDPNLPPPLDPTMRESLLQKLETSPHMDAAEREMILQEFGIKAGMPKNETVRILEQNQIPTDPASLQRYGLQEYVVDQETTEEQRKREEERPREQGNGRQSNAGFVEPIDRRMA